MDFSRDAFLGEDIKIFVEKNAKTKYLDMAIKVNRTINENIDKIQKSIKTHKDVMIMALTIKSMQTFNSVVILNKHGLEADSKALLRVLAEGIIQVAAMINDEEFYMEYLKKSDFQTSIIVKNILNKEHTDFLREETVEAVKQMDFSELEGIIKSMSKEYRPLMKVARKADMLEIYIYVYGELSKYVHSNASIRDEYVDYEGENFKGFTLMPRISDQQYVLCTANYLMIKLLDLYNGYFVCEIDEMIKELWEENKSLFGE